MDKQIVRGGLARITPNGVYKGVEAYVAPAQELIVVRPNRVLCIAIQVTAVILVASFIAAFVYLF